RTRPSPRCAWWWTPPAAPRPPARSARPRLRLSRPPVLPGTMDRRTPPCRTAPEGARRDPGRAMTYTTDTNIDSAPQGGWTREAVEAEAVRRGAKRVADLRDYLDTVYAQGYLN